MSVTSRASRTPIPAPSLGGTLADERNSFARYLSRQRSAKTADVYLSSLDQFTRYLAETGMPMAVEAISREHVESWVEHLQARVSPATVSVRYRDSSQRNGVPLEEAVAHVVEVVRSQVNTGPSAG